MGSQASALDVQERVQGQAEDGYPSSNSPGRWQEGQKDLFNVTVEKMPFEKLGIDLGNTAGNEIGAVVLNISETGVLNDWNRNNPQNPLRVGHIIVEVNEVHGFWEIREQVRELGRLDMTVQRSPPREGWLEEVALLQQAMQTRGASGSLYIRLDTPSRHGRSSVEKTAEALACLPSVQAGECGATHCCICVSDLEPLEQVVQLPCKHSFHAPCAARWLTQSSGPSCPLCQRAVVDGAKNRCDESD